MDDRNTPEVSRDGEAGGQLANGRLIHERNYEAGLGTAFAEIYCGQRDAVS